MRVVGKMAKCMVLAIVNGMMPKCRNMSYSGDILESIVMGSNKVMENILITKAWSTKVCGSTANLTSQLLLKFPTIQTDT